MPVAGHPEPRDTHGKARDAYVKLYREEASSLVKFLIFSGATPEEAWDAAQNAFTKAWEKWTTLKPERISQRAWLRTTAYREFLSEVKIRQHRTIQTPPDQPSTDLPPDALTELDEATAHVRQALSTLPHTQRLHLAWHLDGYTYPEIAKYTGKTQAAVRQNVKRSLDKLRNPSKEVSDDAR